MLTDDSHGFIATLSDCGLLAYMVILTPIIMALCIISRVRGDEMTRDREVRIVGGNVAIMAQSAQHSQVTQLVVPFDRSAQITRAQHSQGTQLVMPFDRSAQIARAQYTQGTQLVMPFDRSAQIARLAMRALPPVKSFTDEDKTNGSQSADDCSICKELFKNGQLIQPFGLCVHEFHSSCLNSWLHSGKTTCPVCRRDLATSIHARGT